MSRFFKPAPSIFIIAFYYFCRTSNGHAEILNIFINNRIGSNHTMLTYLHITYNHRIDSNVGALSNGNLLTLLYNSLIYHGNIYIAILMITISYVHIWRDEYFFSNIQRIGNRYPASLTNFRSLPNSYRPPSDQIWV